MADKPVTREEKYLAYLTGDYKGEIPKPITRKEKYLYELCLKGIGGEISPEEIKAAVNEYLEKNPVKPGATTEQAQQIEQNKTDVAALKEETGSLKEDISTKITKFYASSQGETHLADSDNGKIQDMMLYGKSSQDGTPTPENPVEIKSVVNPTIKVCGKNLLQPNLRYGDEIKINFKKGLTLTMISKNGTNTKGGNLMFTLVDGKQYWLGFDTGSEKHQITLIKDSISATYYFTEESSENYALYIGDENAYEPYKEQSIQLPITLNAIPVSSGGNVTIDGKQYIADYVDVERGKHVQMIQTDKVQSNITWNIQKQQKGYSLGYTGLYKNGIPTDKPGMGKTWKSNVGDSSDACSNAFSFGRSTVFWIVPYENDGNITSDDINAWLVEHPMDIMYPLAEPIETDLTPEENEAFKALVTNYPVTNISVTSDQLDGYTVFNYPISMANGWNYVKQQLNDNRDYIYDMDLQSAEAYVNSEYAVALTELEV